jgi:hypothetical protein
MTQNQQPQRRVRPSDPRESPATENTDESQERSDSPRLRRGIVHWFTPPIRARRELR